MAAACLGALTPAVAAAATPSVAPRLKVTWMRSYAAPGTPAKYDRVGVIRVGPSSAKNVLVLEPGTLAGAAYFVPLAKWIVAKAKGWQVWSVERRENLLEDQSMLNRFKERKATATQLYDYYLGFLKHPRSTHHFKFIPNSAVGFAKDWGMKVAVEDLHRVIGAARRQGGKVVLGGHSLGGTVVTAYATWDFGGKPGADQLAGLVYIDGGSAPKALSAQQATAELDTLRQPHTSPWLAFGGIQAPLAGLFNATGSAAALLDPGGPSLGQASGLLPSDLVPPVKVTNAGQYGYALNVGTSPQSLVAAQAHLGQGLTAKGPRHGWNGAGALTPLSRYATMFSGYPMLQVDGTEWYFPQRLTDDSGAVANGNANPAQKVLGLDATMGHHLPRELRIYAFGAHLGGSAVLRDAQLLAAQSHIPASHLTLVDRQGTYAHNDPAGAYPHNAFFADLVPFLHTVSSSPSHHKRTSASPALGVSIRGNPHGLQVGVGANRRGVIMTPVVAGSPQRSTGTLAPITLVDARGTLKGWSLVVRLAHRYFTAVSGQAARRGGKIPATDLSLGRGSTRPQVACAANGRPPLHVPSCVIVQAVQPRGGAALAGPTGRVAFLASAAHGGGGGSFSVRSGLSLEVPGGLASGTYRDTLVVMASSCTGPHPLATRGRSCGVMSWAKVPVSVRLAH